MQHSIIENKKLNCHNNLWFCYEDCSFFLKSQYYLQLDFNVPMMASISALGRIFFKIIMVTVQQLFFTHRPPLSFSRDCFVVTHIQHTPSRVKMGGHELVIGQFQNSYIGTGRKGRMSLMHQGWGRTGSSSGRGSANQLIFQMQEVNHSPDKLLQFICLFTY